MKHGKNPTVRQKKLLTTLRLNYENWLIVKDTPDILTVVHRVSGKQRTLDKSVFREVG